MGYLKISQISSLFSHLSHGTTLCYKYVNITSKILQEKDLCLQRVVSHLKKTEEFLVTARSDLEFKKVLVDVNEVAEEVAI